MPKEYNVLVDDFAGGKHRSCAACGGEIDSSAFGEWVTRVSKNLFKKLEELRTRQRE